MGFLFAAYVIILTVVFAYVFFMLYRQRRLKEDIEFLKQTLEEKEEDLSIPDPTISNREGLGGK